MSAYRLKFLPEALDEWNALDGSVKSVLRKLLKKRLEQPHVPGAELHGALRDCYKIKLLKQGYRLVYQVEDDVLVVLVLAVAKREDQAVYRSAIERLLQERVAPWVERFPWQAATPLRYDESEGYKGRGVVGCRAGPLDSIGFENLAHELAHAFEILESKGPGALGQPQWGMRIRTRVRVGSQVLALYALRVGVFSRHVHTPMVG